MPKITQIQTDNKTGRAVVYIDYRFCASIKQDIWSEMNLKAGDEITCAKLHQKESMIWRKSKKPSVVNATKQAMNRIMLWFAKYLPSLEAKIIDFKFCYNSIGHSLGYSKPRYDQIIRITLKGTGLEVITLEVATSNIRRGTDHFVVSDKVSYAKSKNDSWIVLYYKYPVEKFVWVKPANKEYKSEKLLGTTNDFIAFTDKSPEVYSSKDFCEYIQKKIKSIFSGLA